MASKLPDWKLGSVCWTYLPGLKGLYRGRIVDVLPPVDRTFPVFVVQMDRRDWMTLECRDATLLSRAQDELPPVWKRGPA